MKKLSIILVVIIVMLAGCMELLPLPDPEEVPEPSPTVTVQPTVSPTETMTPEPTVSQAPAETPVAEDTPDLPVVSDKTLSYENKHINADIHCPEISGMLDVDFQQELNDSVYSDLKAIADDTEQTSSDDPTPESNYYVNSKFTVHRNDGIFLSISEYIEFYDGGATDSTILKFINIRNDESGKRLAIVDLFEDGADYMSVINETISGMISANPEMSDFTFTEIREDQGFYLTDSALVIAFQNYDIAPGVYGPQEFSIPLADLSDYLIPELT